MHVLVAEDDQVSLRIMQKKLESWGHAVHLATNGLEGWEQAKSIPIDIVVSDWMMPGIDGLELCRRIRNSELGRYIYFIIFTAKDKQQDIVHCLEAGVDDYIAKPLDFDEVHARLEIGVRIVRLERELSRRYKAIRKNSFQIIRMFTSLIEVLNEDLGGHCRRVAKLSLNLARRIAEVSDSDLPTLETAGLLHDIGMVGLPAESIAKRAIEMSGDERDSYRSHPTQGEVILKEIESLQPVAELVRAHHEQFNGRGFPDGLDGGEIPLLARILSAADAYDNLVHKWKIPLEDLPDYLQRQRGYQLDPDILDHLLAINLEAIQDEEIKEFSEILLDDLKEGMILAKDVRMKNGALLMPAITELTSYSIEKLKRYFQLKCIVNRLSIYKYSQGG
ncbi:MAG: response regulator [Thermodesulfobacteriota bacterium]|nr:response regulator [Thermodesulfobacteriota bacterium]